ncbi:MAG: hypothetical protein WB630_03205 [Candidatus Acidiferrales bacterium]
MVALTGYRDKPTDGVVDYCNFLRQALAKRGVQLQVVAVPVDEQSWWPALRRLWRQAGGWRGCWVLLQYTALAWSRRGFPFLTLAALAILRMRGARCAIVFHEPGGLDGPRAIDHMRCRFQNWTVRTLHRFSSKSVFTVPLETEQMMQSRLLVASDIGGLGDMVDGVGLKFPAGDAAALAARMRQALDDPAMVRI